MIDYLAQARHLLRCFPNRHDGLRCVAMALVNIIPIEGDPKKRGHRANVSANGAAMLYTLQREFNADYGYVASGPDGRSVEDLRSRLSKVIYGARQADVDPYLFVLGICGLKSWTLPKSAFNLLVAQLDPGSIGVPTALARVEPYLHEVAS